VVTSTTVAFGSVLNGGNGQRSTSSGPEALVRQPSCPAVSAQDLRCRPSASRMASVKITRTRNQPSTNQPTHRGSSTRPTSTSGTAMANQIT
jgi:hypothetical protein